MLLIACTSILNQELRNASRNVSQNHCKDDDMDYLEQGYSGRRRPRHPGFLSPSLGSQKPGVPGLDQKLKFQGGEDVDVLQRPDLESISHLNVVICVH